MRSDGLSQTVANRPEAAGDQLVKPIPRLPGICSHEAQDQWDPSLAWLAGCNEAKQCWGGCVRLVCGFHADSDTHSTHIRTVIPR